MVKRFGILVLMAVVVACGSPAVQPQSGTTTETRSGDAYLTGGNGMDLLVVESQGTGEFSSTTTGAGEPSLVP